MRNLVGLSLAAAFLISSATTFALDIPLWDLRVGIRGGPNINILTEVVEEDTDPVYPGFVDVGWCIGGSLAVDYMDIVGLELELLYSSESVSGTAEFNGDLGTDSKKESSDLILEASSLHFPIFVRGQIPTGVARPFLHLGVDFVLSRSDHNMIVEQLGDAPAYTDGCQPGTDCDPFPQQNFHVNPIDSSTFFLVGFGLDMDVGPVTIPVEFRGLFNLGFSDSIEDRVTRTNGGAPYGFNNEWHYQVMVLFGVNYLIF